MAKAITSCDSCVYYVYDEEYETYFCEINLDEDEMAKFMSSSYYNCPYFRPEDEYKTGRKQI